MNINDFIVGKFYKLKGIEYNTIWYFKIKEIKKKNLFFDGFWIYDNIFYVSATNKAHVKFDSKNNYVEIQIDEIIDILPDSNIDKINYIRRKRIEYLLKTIK